MTVDLFYVPQHGCDVFIWCSEFVSWHNKREEKKIIKLVCKLHNRIISNLDLITETVWRMSIWIHILWD